MQTTILKEVKTAYADCDDSIPWEKAEKIRNLHFRASKAVTPAEAFEILKECVPGYNNFVPKLVKLFPPEARITIAREGSVCLYISGVTADDPNLPNEVALHADEYDWTDGILRVWYD